MVFSVVKRKLTVPAALTGGCLGVMVYLGAGFTGITLLGLFFLLGVWATGWKKNEKQTLTETPEGEIRTAAQVWANGGVAGILGFLSFTYPQQAVVYQLAMAASLASATADTLSSELGMVYGRRFYNIITGKKDRRGLDGVISAEGTFAGVLGSALIAGVHMLGLNGTLPQFLLIVLCGTFGNLFDSFLGAAWERRHFINNNVVNFMNTLAAAALMLIFML